MSRRKKILLILVILLGVPAAAVGVTAAVAPQVLMQMLVPAPPATVPPPPVKYSMNSEIRALLRHPTTLELVDEHLPGFSEIEQIEVAGPLTLHQAQPYYPELLGDEKLARFKTELDALPPLEPPLVYSAGATEIGTLLDDPEARAILDKHLDNFSQGDQVHLARPFTLAFIQKYAPEQITDEALQAIDAELAVLAESKTKK